MRTSILSVAVIALVTAASCGESTQNSSGKTSDSSTLRQADTTHHQHDTSTVPIMDTVHTTRNSLDWNGTYTGTLPCGDCEGIKTSIELKNDNTYTIKEEYLGKKGGSFNDKGTFEWDKTGSIITLKQKDRQQQYKVIEGSILHLDQEGKEITGALADKYALHKQGH